MMKSQEIHGNRLKVLFVGGFSHPKDGSVGGQMFACQSLVSSKLAERVDFVLLDTTNESLPPPPIFKRGIKAVGRVFRFLVSLIFDRPQIVLIFTASGAGFVEKGFMATLASLFRRPVLFAPRSGKDEALMKRSRFFRWYLPFVLRRCRLVICQSAKLAEFYRSAGRLNDDQVRVVPNWIDTAACRVPRTATKDGTIHCVYLGWMEPHKGIYELLEVISKRRDEFRGVRFSFAGGGGELKPFKKRVEALELDRQVSCLGWVTGPAKAELLASAHVFVSFSFAEGMPNALLEAAASGCACVATDVGGSESIIPDANHGRLIPPADQVALGDALKELFSNPSLSEALGARVRRHVEERFSVEQGASRFEALFREVV